MTPDRKLLHQGREKMMRLQTQLDALSSRPGCKTCEHYRSEGHFSGRFEYCAHPIYCEIQQDLGDGGVEVVPLRTPITFAREEGAVCGPEGHLYERKPLARLRTRFSGVRWLNLLGLVAVTLVVGFVGKRADLILLPLLWAGWFYFFGLPIKIYK